ncbi:branched-chain amino acid ABC transporter substrate-binding protein [Burkholderia multivorans]|nr:branched-chain amino acid ABC transporter substrate-binding protein [Burkholderia multivorans]
MTLPALLRRAAGAALVLACATAHADLKVGVDLSSTGPAAAIGITSKNAILMWPKTIAGQPLQVTVLDDASDPGAAVRNIRKLVDEDHVDVVVGPNITPAALAALDAVAAGQTPMITLVGSGAIVEPQEGARAWVFKVPQNDQLMADAMPRYMAKHGVKTVGFIGFADAYGDSWYNTFSAAAQKNGIKIVSNERYNRTDASVMGQVLKLVGSNPDAVLIAGSGTPAALPAKTLKERGYKGKVYQTHGVANNDFLRVCGKDCDGELLPAGPVLVTDQLPDSNPVKKPALAYKAAYEKAYGAGSLSTFGGHAWDAGLLLQRAIPDALKKGQPGTEAFREALRASLESVKDLPVSHGVINMTPTDHNGFDSRARVMVQIVDGKWKLQAE